MKNFTKQQIAAVAKAHSCHLQAFATGFCLKKVVRQYQNKKDKVVWRVYDAFKIGYAEFASLRSAKEFINVYLTDVQEIA